MFHAYLRNKFSIVRLLNRPDKNQDYKVTDFLRKNQRLNQLFYFLMQQIQLVVFHRVCLRPVCLRSDDAKLIDNFVFHIKKANFML